MNERLDQDERRALSEVASQIVRGKEIVALCAYGSQVAGYARAESDYDIIVAVKGFRQTVKYMYVKEPVRVSALIVDSKSMLDDSQKASLGEFVAGRLLNVFEPITNDEYFRKAEFEYKERVMLESLLEIASDYGEFAQDLIVPFDYFLFDKLHKRAMIYPPAFYSYVKTYTCGAAAENRAFSVRGFRGASTPLENQGVVRVEGDRIRIVREKMKGSSFNKLLSLVNLTTRGVAQYAVHGYAGRVGLRVIASEARSKVKRMREKTDFPPELQNPKILFRLDEGRVFTSTSEMLDELAKMSGLAKYKHEEKTLGEVYSTRRLLTIEGSKRADYVLKHFADIRSIKWALLGAWAFSRKFSMMPQARLHREYVASRKLRERGVRTPEVVGVAINEKVLVTEYIEGKLLSDEVEQNLQDKSVETEDIFRYGSTLAQIHRIGYALGDSKAGNVIIKGGEVYMTDLEQAEEGGDAAWDVAEFLYYTAKLSMREDGMRRVAEAFLRGYTQGDGREVVSKAANPKYLAPFRPFITRQMTKTISKLLTEYSN